MGEYGAADEIAKLADLKERGLLSEREFEEQRERILEGTKPERKHRVPVLGIVAAVILVVALIVGLVEGTSSGPSRSTSGNNTVHLSLASETTTENSVVQFATKLLNTDQYDGACLAFVVEAYEQAGFPIRNHVSITIGTQTVPAQVWPAHSGGISGGPTTEPPVGALFFWNNTHGAAISHVAISTGGWNFISTTDAYATGIHRETMVEFNKNSWAIPVGWWLPDGSNASPPAQAAPATLQPTAAPRPTTTPTTASLHVAPGPSGTPVGGSSLQPAGGSTLQPAAGGGTVQPAGGSGATGGGGSNNQPPSGSSGTQATPTTTVTPATPASPPPAPTTYSETVGGVSHTWTNYTNAGGTEGPSIAAYQTVQIACKITGFAVADGNTWWYRIEQSPWSNQYYVSADAFYNDGATSGSLHGTPFVDPAVPNC